MHIWLLHLVFRVSGISHQWVLCLFLVFGGIVLGEMTQTATFGPLKVLLVFYSPLSRICVCCVCLFLSLFLISKICNVGHIHSHTFCFLNEILQRLLDVTSSPGRCLSSSANVREWYIPSGSFSNIISSFFFTATIFLHHVGSTFF